MDDIIYVLTLVSALGSGLVAGWFFTYSNQIMTVLGRRPDAEGIATMQQINIVVINPLAMTALFGTALACIALSILSVIEWNEPEVLYHLAGSAVYMFGAAIETMVFNVPRNNALAAADPVSPAGAALWRRFLTEWTAGNHVRTIAALVAAALLTVGLAEM